MASSTGTLHRMDRIQRFRNPGPVLTATLVVLLLGAGTLLVYATGGTQYAWPYLVLVPVLIAAARFRIVGGLLAGFAGGLLLGPFMPLDVDAGIAQQTTNWLVRLTFYTGLGGFTGLLFWLIRHEAEQRERQARLDGDTGLPNKTALVETLQRRRLDHAPTPLLYLVRVLDLAEIIEVAGVGGADELIRELERRFRAAIDVPIETFRFSASELLVLHPAAGMNRDIPARTILQVTETPLEIFGVPVHVELAIGSTGGDSEPLEPRELVRQARVALFHAVEGQLSHRHYDPSLEQESAQTVRLLGRVRHGLEQGEFELHYQPKLQARGGGVDGCEALVRWRDPDSGELIPPGRFMPRVEHSALIRPLTLFVARTAGEFSDRSGTRTSINLSARNLLDRDLLQTLERMAADVPEGSLEAEITESAIVRDPASARRSIEQLREAGLRVSLDDFGTGYSSFEYLRWLPLTALKIDRVFLRDLGEDPAAERLLACMIEVGHALGMEVVAEGVETREQFDILQRLGCDLVQGFLFARPMPEEAYSSWCSQYAAASTP